jgi:hypothetical protein
MYLDYQEFVNQCQTNLEESQRFWEKEMATWQQVGQDYLSGAENQIIPDFQEKWCTQTVKETFTMWEKGWHFLEPWFHYSLSAGGNPSQNSYVEISKKLDQLNASQTQQKQVAADQKLEIDRQKVVITEHKKKTAELSRQVTLLKKDLTAQKQVAKSQAAELEAFKDNLGFQEKALAACEAQLKALKKSK